MAIVTKTKEIRAPIEMVFDAVAHVGTFKEVAPHILKVEMLSEVSKGVGAKFRETREMNGKQSSTVLECTQYQENHLVRFIADEGGTIWDSLFTTTANADGTRLSLEMEARPHKFMSRIITPLIMGMIGKAIEDDMDSIKAWCENNPAG